MNETTKKYLIIALKVIIYALGLLLGGFATSVTAQTLINHVA